MKFTILPLAVLLSGCAALTEMTSKTADQLAKAADQYCMNTTAGMREIMRSNVNSKLEVAKSAEIDC